MSIIQNTDPIRPVSDQMGKDWLKADNYRRNIALLNVTLGLAFTLAFGLIFAFAFDGWVVQ